MLEEKTGIDANQDRWAEPAEEPEKTACAIGVFERSLLTESTCARFPNGRDDPGRGVEDEEPIRE